MEKSYAQLGADQMIWFHLGKKTGVKYIDVGCLWPIAQSSTYLFYQNEGNGLCIDPNPAAAPLFAKMRPRDVFVNVGVAPIHGSLEYFMHAQPVYNSFNRETASKLQARHAAGRGDKFALLETRAVDVKPLEQIISETQFDASSLDLLSVDTEGFDEAILRSIDYSTIRPTVICFEHIVDRKDQPDFNIYRLPLVEFLEGHGYFVAGFTGHDVCMKLRAD